MSGSMSAFVSAVASPSISELRAAPAIPEVQTQARAALRGVHASQQSGTTSSSSWGAAASAGLVGSFVMVTSRQQRRKNARTAQKAATIELPKVDRSTTKAFRKQLMKSEQYFRFSKTQMEGAMEDLKSTSGSELLAKIRQNGFRITIGDVTFVLAESYGFCWGVERTLAMAYEARNHFPDKNVWVTNEIIHNAVINKGLEDKGMKFVQKDKKGNKDWSAIKESDVVILPAFGASVDEMSYLKDKNVTIVDAACPWVSKVWNSVEKNKDKGHTSIIHGKHAHEETVATKSFADKYLVVKDMKEAEYVAKYMLEGGSKAEFMKKFAVATSEGFDPDTDLDRIGVANQTTMMKGETELIGRLFERTVIKKFGPEEVNQHFLAFNTICDATQERQDAMYKLFKIKYDAPQSDLYGELEGEQVGVKLVSDKKGKAISSKAKENESRGGVEAAEPVGAKNVDLCIVVGGFNSSNTTHLIEIPQEVGVPTYHVDCPARIGGSSLLEGRPVNAIQHKPLSTKPEVAMLDQGLEITENFLPAGPITIAVTAGASTPDSSVGACLDRILTIRGLKSPIQDAANALSAAVASTTQPSAAVAPAPAKVARSSSPAVVQDAADASSLRSFLLSA